MSLAIRQQINRAAYRVLSSTGAAMLHRRSAGVIFCYHNVVSDAIAGRVGNPWLHAGVSEFSAQAEWIASRFTVVPIAELHERLSRGQGVKGLAALTFDDGYTGCVTNAIPILRNLSLPFALFPVVEGSDQRRPFWWDLYGRITTEERERYLTELRGDHDMVLAASTHRETLPEDVLPASWEMLKSVLGDDCTIGVHGVTHRNLAALSADEVTWELKHARGRICQELGVTARFLAYPYGCMSPVVMEEVERAGFEAAFGLDFGLVRPGASAFQLARITVPAGLSPATFACWGSGVQLRRLMPLARSVPASADRDAWTFTHGSWRFRVGSGRTHARYRERELVNRGVPLPFASRSAVHSLPEYSPSVFFAVLNEEEACVGGFSVASRSVPHLPGHRVLRVEQFGSSVPAEAAESAVAALVEWLRRDPRILRLNVDVFAIDGSRAAVARALARHGFRRAEHTNGYIQTILIDLERSEEEIFADLHHSARRKIRQLQRHGVVIRPIEDADLEPRMNELLLATYARTGGAVQPRDWRSRIQLSRDNPDLSRVVGLFRTDVTGPASLLAFAWGCHSGNHVYYAEAASTRDTGPQRIPVAYGVMWDLILWAKRTGARVFDMGGITRGTHADDDPLGGISDFKRYFSRNIVEVREEWILDDHTWRASVARAVHRRMRRN